MGRVVFWLRIALSLELIERHGARLVQSWAGLDWLNIEALSSRNKRCGGARFVFLGFWEGKKLSCQFMTATSFCRAMLVQDEEFYTGPRTREKKNEMHWGACWLGKDEQALQRVQHGWRYRYGHGHR